MTEAGTDVVLMNANKTLEGLINATVNATLGAGASDAEDETTSTSTRLLIAFVWVLTIAFCVCSKPNIPESRFHQSGPQNSTTRKKKVKIDPEQRKKLVDEALISKVIAAYGESNVITLKEPPSRDQPDEETAPAAPTTEDAIPSPSGYGALDVEDDEDDNSCMICLERFCVGETVAFSKRNIGCLHVFHRECIEPWLMKHNECPCCRTEFIRSTSCQPCEKSDPSESHENDEEMNRDERAEESQSMAFVIIHGLLSSVRRARYSLVSGEHQSNYGTEAGPTTQHVETDATVLGAGPGAVCPSGSNRRRRSRLSLGVYGHLGSEDDSTHSSSTSDTASSADEEGESGQNSGVSSSTGELQSGEVLECDLERGVDGQIVLSVV